MVVSRRHWNERGLEPCIRVKKSDTRGAATYVAIIADNAGIQAGLPHFLIMNESKLTKALERQVASLPASHLQVWRRKSAWNTADCMVEIIQHLATHLAPWLARYTPILLLDQAPCHLPAKVMEAARDAHIHLVYIPSSLTSVLQPLDVAAFSTLKMWWAAKFQALRQASDNHEVSELAWMELLRTVPRKFFAARSWSRAFTAVGTAGDVTILNRALKRQLGDTVVMSSSDKPTPEQLSCIWLKRRRMEYAYPLLMQPGS
ncbi:unnamed protein product [Symbiodinium sp. CCMP2592]|nr:unnamed protein product [Symbiodinium sp. CCMP2592]